MTRGWPLFTNHAQIRSWPGLAGRSFQCPVCRLSTRKAWSPSQMLSKTGLLRHAFRARIRHPVNRNGDHHRLCQGRTHRHCAMDRLTCPPMRWMQPPNRADLNDARVL